VMVDAITIGKLLLAGAATGLCGLTLYLLAVYGWR
jgi:hypothetical protein